MSKRKDQLKDFRPPKDWASERWHKQIMGFDPDYVEILIPWLETLSPDLIHHYIRNMDVSEGTTDRQVAFWLIDQPNLDRATARFLFWQLLDQFPYFGPSDQFDDEEHGVPALGEALKKLVARLKRNDFPATGLAVTRNELKRFLERHEQNRAFALKQGWTSSEAPFEFPEEWSRPIAEKAPSVPLRFPAPTEPLVAAYLMSSSMPTCKEMYKLAEKYDMPQSSDRFLVWGAWIVCVVFVVFAAGRLIR